MTTFDYDTQAELFPGKDRAGMRRPLRYQRFAFASAAIRFAVEELPPELFVGAYLQVEEDRFDRQAIRRLYNSTEYPLARKKAAVRHIPPSTSRPGLPHGK